MGVGCQRRVCEGSVECMSLVFRLPLRSAGASGALGDGVKCKGDRCSELKLRAFSSDSMGISSVEYLFTVLRSSSSAACASSIDIWPFALVESV